MTALAAKLAPEPLPPIAPAITYFGTWCRARARRWSRGEIDHYDAIDLLNEAAEQYGLVAEVGLDALQAVIADAFAAVPEPTHEKLPQARAAASTVEALMFSLCRRGASALAERSCRRRLAELSTAQICEVIRRLIAARSRFPAIDDELLFQLGEQLA